MTRNSGILFFAALYFVQGAILTYIQNFQKPYLFSQGVTGQQISWLYTAMLVPFVAKIFLGFLSDRVRLGRFGRRRPYMIVGLVAAAYCYLQVALILPHQQFSVFFAFMVMASLGMALFDTAADGFAVDTAPKVMQGRVQASMVAGKSAGFIVMSIVFGKVIEHYAYAAVFKVIAALLMMALIWVLIRAKERSSMHGSHADSEQEPAPAGQVSRISAMNAQSLRDCITVPFIIFCIYGVVYSIPSFGIDGMATLYFSQVLQISVSDVGLYGALRGAGALLGAGLAVVLIDHLGLKRSGFWALVLLAIVGLGLTQISSGRGVYIAAICWGLAWAIQETIYVTWAMRFAGQGFAATIFALTMMFSNLGTMIGEYLSSQMIGLLDFRQILLTLAVSALFVIPLVRRLPSA